MNRLWLRIFRKRGPVSLAPVLPPASSVLLRASSASRARRAVESRVLHARGGRDPGYRPTPSFSLYSGSDAVSKYTATFGCGGQGSIYTLRYRPLFLPEVRDFLPFYFGASRLYIEMSFALPHGRSSRRLQVLAHFSADVRCPDSALITPGRPQ